MKDSITVSSAAQCAGDLARIQTASSVVVCILLVACVVAIGWALWQELDR